jgi:hypothetical protein
VKHTTVHNTTYQPNEGPFHALYRLSVIETESAPRQTYYRRSNDRHPPVRLLPDLRKQQQRVQKLIRMRTTYEQYRSFCGYIECSSGSYLPKEYIDDDPPEDKDKVV